MVPLFVCPGNGVRKEIPSLPGQYHLSVDQLGGEAEEIAKLGIPSVMLFDIQKDPHLLRNVADIEHKVRERGLALLEQWHAEMMRTSEHDFDPMDKVIAEGGPFHTRGASAAYCERLRRTGRAHHAELLERLGGEPIDHV